MQPVTHDEIETLLNAHPIVVVDFSSPWCAPCRALEKALAAEGERRPGLVIVHVDITEQQALSQAQGIRATPTLVAFRDGQRVGMEAGYAGPVRLARFLDRLEAR
jgi:thioredoxin-like negative regulator of GroEL